MMLSLSFLDSTFYGISPNHDTFRIIKCKECNKIISLTYFGDHLGEVTFFIWQKD